MAAQLFALLTTPGVYIDNTRARVDVRGMLMDVHDGNVAQWEPGGRYYWYGIGYRNCTLSWTPFPPQYCKGVWEAMGVGCGFRTDHALSIYSSPDLLHWTYEGDGLPAGARPPGIYFRPKVVFDPRTKEFVLWVNYLRQSASWWAACHVDHLMAHYRMTSGRVGRPPL